MSDSGLLQGAGAVAHHRPGYHLRPTRGYVNDPNGPIMLGEVAHLYFQSRPIADLAVPVEWGHATSTDFLHWQMHRPAMAPVPDGLDRDGCWSGNTVLDNERVRAFYSGRIHESPYQSVLTAVSDDGGYTFGPPQLALPDPAPEEGVTMYRDPFVWWAGDRWLMAVGVGYAEEVAAIRLYGSTDLSEWTQLTDLASLPRHAVDKVDAGSAWECPQIFDFGSFTVAVVGSWTPSSGPNGVLAFSVDNPSGLALVDHGANFYAPSALRDSPHGPVMFGWVTEGRGQEEWAAAEWAGALSLPRQVWWDGSLRSAPVPTAINLRGGSERPANGTTIGTQSEIILPTAPARLIVRFSDAEQIVIDLDPEMDTLTIDQVTVIGRTTATAPGAFDAASSRPAARVFIDGSIIEVFTSAGQALTTRAYPIDPPPWHISAPDDASIWELGSAAGFQG
jgi:beta-fructofuranosidase